MKVVQVNVSYNHGGAGKIVKYIHDGLTERGIDSRVAFGRGEASNDARVFKMGLNWDVNLHALTARIIGINGFMSQISTYRLIKYLKNENPDIIHLHGLHGYYVNVAMLFNYLNKNRKPVLWTFHDEWAFTGKCGVFVDCFKWKVGCNHCPQKKEYPKSYFFDFSSYMWNKKKELFTNIERMIVVSPSKWLSNDIKNSYFSKYVCEVINNGIDATSQFFDREKGMCRRKHGISQKDKIVLCVAYDLSNPTKGTNYVLSLAKHLLDRTDIKIILIGWDKKNDEKIKELTNVVTYPFTSNQDELAEFYTLSDVFLIPSLIENYPTTVLESMACGTPVVGFNVGGIPEQLSDGRGIIVEKGDETALLNAVLSVLNNTAGVVTKSVLIDYIRKNNSITSMVNKYENIYLELLDKH